MKENIAEAERKAFEDYLKTSLDGYQWYPLLKEAAGYSLFAGGKRVRPLLLILAGLSLGLSREELYPWAAALEMIHTYSLIHDDLPAMDNDDYRRGRLTNHKVYGEGQAIQAGDALLSFAFCIATGECVKKPGRTELAAHLLAGAAWGMVCGQSADLDFEKKEAGLPDLQYIEHYKTGCLLTVPLRMAGALSGASEEKMNQLKEAGFSLGSAFQIYDDVLDVEGNFASLGKSLHKDENNGKATFVTCFGLEQAKAEAKKLTEVSLQNLAWLSGEYAETLREFVRGLIERNN